MLSKELFEDCKYGWLHFCVVGRTNLINLLYDKLIDRTTA